MIALLVAAAVAFIVAIFTTPSVIGVLRSRDIGQFIREDVEGHAHKHGTPTMGGVVILLAVVVGYLVAHIRVWVPGEGFTLEWRDFTGPGLLAIGAALGMGFIGFLDDYSKVRRERNLGLSKRWKFLGQLAVAGLFAWGAVATEVSTELSFTRGLGIDLGPAYVVIVLLMLTATANAVNLTDGLDGLAAGSGSLVFGAFVIMAFWQFRNPSFYEVGDALDLAIVAAAMMAAALGFLWWNAAPAQVFMGDVGSQGLGGAMAALALLTNTHLLLVVLGGLYVVETLSVIVQVIAFRGFGRRVFRMTPIHHHFELAGWPETTIIVRFWILGALMVALGLGMFYGDFISTTGSLG
jgi:phospho-N-acetylmuramoyl-pentapeptide-transferase